MKSFLKIIEHIDWATGLTGTPASNGYKDLHGQYLVVDRGQRLGTSKTAFHQRFYYKPTQFVEIARPETESVIKTLIGDITYEIGEEELGKMPDLIVNDIEVELPPDLRERYDQMERDMFLKLDSGREKDMFNQASLMNACLQFSNGAIYPLAGVPLWEPLHELKLDALEDVIEEDQGSPVFCAYQYRHDAERIMTKFKHLNPVNLTECKSQRALDDAMDRWKRGECPLMIGHAASVGHGVDGLQQTGSIIVWFGLTFSLDLYDQFNARLRRQGQGKPVTCHRIITKDTLDQAQAEALSSKATTQAGLMMAVREYRKQKGV